MERIGCDWQSVDSAEGDGAGEWVAADVQVAMTVNPVLAVVAAMVSVTT